MDRSDTHRRISILCRGRHGNALFALGYLTQMEQTVVLEQLLEALEEFHLKSGELLPGSEHLVAFEERFGRIPRS